MHERRPTTPTTDPGPAETSLADTSLAPPGRRATRPTEPGAGDARPARRRPARLSFVVLGLAALAIALISISTYAQGTLRELAADDAGLASAYADEPALVQGALYVHIAASAFALVAGLPQLSARLRRRAPRGHRVLGRAYLVAVGVGAAASLVILPANSAGSVGVFGFGTLAFLWVGSGTRALLAIRRGDVASHEAWMLRTYALTFAAVTLRTWTGVLIAVQLPGAGPDPDAEALFMHAYAAVPFLCWLPNVVVAEWLIRRRGLPAYRLSASPTPRRTAPQDATVGLVVPVAARQA